MSDRVFDNGWQEGYLRREWEVFDELHWLPRWLMRNRRLTDEQISAIRQDFVAHHKPADGDLGPTTDYDDVVC